MKAMKSQAKRAKAVKAKKPSLNKQKSTTKKISKKKMAKVDELPESSANSQKEVVNSQSNTKKPNTGGSEAFIQFFYTNDKFMNQFEDREIVQEIQVKHPLFMKDGTSDSDLKKQIAAIIQDKSFFTDILGKYDLKLEDFFKFVFRLESSIFKGPFIGKIQRLLREGNYLN